MNVGIFVGLRDFVIDRCHKSALLWLALAAATIGCRAPASQTPAVAAAAPVTAPAAASAVPHGDHNPHHGGVVMMKGDMHYELVVDASGHAQLYFTDAVREDLPASIASSASVTLQHAGALDEIIPLRIDDSGESWVGSGHPVDRAKTAARLSFTIKGEPYSIDLPLAPQPVVASPQPPVPATLPYTPTRRRSSR